MRYILRSRLLISVLAAAWFAVVLFRPVHGGEPVATSGTGGSAQSDEKQIQGWIAQLDAKEFQVREQATKMLSESGPNAVQFLSAATQSPSREVAHRSLSLLEHFLNQKKDEKLSSSAEQILQEIAESKTNWGGQHAAQVLLQANLVNQPKVLKRLVELGAESNVDDEDPMADIRLIIQAKNWHGKDRDWQLLKKLPSLRHVSIFGPIVDDDQISALASLNMIDEIDLYGTKISDRACVEIKNALPYAHVDRRKGGMLGITGDRYYTDGCLVREIHEKSAAQEAGLQPDDIIKKIDGKELNTFSDLTAIISEKQSGDKIKLEVLRGEETIGKEVAF